MTNFAEVRVEKVPTMGDSVTEGTVSKWAKGKWIFTQLPANFLTCIMKRLEKV